MTDSQQSILMLGGSAQQVVAIRKAKELGYRTVVCDYLPNNPGQHDADVFYLESTTDRETMFEIARKENVSGVLAYSSDPASPVAAYVADKLGLPTNPPEAIEVMSFKHLFRQHLRDHGFPCPHALSFEEDISAKRLEQMLSSFDYPLVIKPTDSSGSKGVTVINDSKELSAAINQARVFSRNGLLLAEEYIEATFPRVIGGDIFVVDGQVRFWGLMSCVRNAANGLVPCGEMTPSGLSEGQYVRVKSVLQKLVTSLGIRFGELNVEVIIGKSDTPYVLELASRAGGNMIPVELSDASGIDLVAANVLCAMGADVGTLSYDTFHSPSILTYVLHSDTAGVFSHVEYSQKARSALYRECLYLHEGDAVEVFNGANKALGILFLRFESKEDMDRFVSEVHKHIRPVLREAA